MPMPRDCVGYRRIVAAAGVHVSGHHCTGPVVGAHLAGLAHTTSPTGHVQKHEFTKTVHERPHDQVANLAISIIFRRQRVNSRALYMPLGRVCTFSSVRFDWKHRPGTIAHGVYRKWRVASHSQGRRAAERLQKPGPLSIVPRAI